MLARKEQPQVAAATVKLEVGLSGLDLGMHPMTNVKPSSKNKRRFSDDQIRSLEFMFESDSRPESQIKQQLANELGLQPRQIAIWFQNRRARTKSKQLERDYSILKQSYDALSSSYESLKRDNQSLHIQLQKMKSQLDMQHANETYGPKRTTSEDGEAENRSAVFKPNQKINFLFEGCDGMLSSNKNSIKVENMNGDGAIGGDMIEATDGSLNTSKRWCSFESNCFLDESSCSSNWWEYW